MFPLRLLISMHFPRKILNPPKTTPRAASAESMQENHSWGLGTGCDCMEGAEPSQEGCQMPWVTPSTPRASSALAAWCAVQLMQCQGDGCGDGSSVLRQLLKTSLPSLSYLLPLLYTCLLCFFTKNHPGIFTHARASPHPVAQTGPWTPCPANCWSALLLAAQMHLLPAGQVSMVTCTPASRPASAGVQAGATWNYPAKATKILGCKVLNATSLL